MRTELAQYRELAAFAQFGSELDESAREQLAQGERIREALKQGQYRPVPMEYQVVLMFAVTRGMLLEVPTEKIVDFERELYGFMDSRYPEILQTIRETKDLTAETEEELTAAVRECVKEKGGDGYGVRPGN